MDRHADRRARELPVRRRCCAAQDGSQLTPVTLGRLARRLTAQGADSSVSAMPAGYTYLGQFVAHDLSFDMTAHGLDRHARASPSSTRRAPRRSTSTRSTGRPARRRLGSASTRTRGPLAGDRDDACPRTTVPALRRPRPARAARPDATPSAGRAHRRRAQRRQPRRRADHAAFIRFHNRVVATRDGRRCARGRAARAARGASSRGTSSGSSGSTSCRGSATRRARRRVARTGGRPSSRARAATTRRRCRSSSPSASFRLGHSMVREHVRLEPLRRPRPSRTCSSTPGVAATSAGSRACGAPASPTSAGCYDFPGGDRRARRPCSTTPARRIDTRLTHGLRDAADRDVRRRPAARRDDASATSRSAT